MLYNDKNINFCKQNSVHIVLEASQSIEKVKKHDLVLKIAIPHLEYLFLVIIFLDSHSMIYVD